MFYFRLPYWHIIWLAAFALAGTPATAGENYAERQILPIHLGVGSGGDIRHMNTPAGTADLNGDGLQDVVFHIVTANAVEANPIMILLNDGAGSLVDATSEMIAGPVPKNTLTRQIIIEDFNGDGQLDIFLDNTGTEVVSPFLGEINQLLLSGPDGKLRDMTAEKLPGLHVYSSGSSAADIDGDGDIDIWVNSGAINETFAGVHLMLNDGTGGFTIVADLLITPVDTVGPNGRLPEALVGTSGSWTAFIDAENDGDFDLYLAGVDNLQGGPDRIRPWLLLNDGSGRFTDAGADAIPTRTFGNETLAANSIVLDINGDGFDDLLLLESPIGIKGEGCTLRELKSVVAVLISNGDGTFRDETFTRTPQTTDCHIGFDIELGDIDGDGAVDILLPGERTEILLNDGSGNFSFLPENFVDVEDGLVVFNQPVDINADGITDFLENLDGGPRGFDILALIKRNVPPTPLFSTVRPRVLSAQVGSTVTAFATLTNAGPTPVTGCTIRAAVTTPADFLFQTTDPATNAVIGGPNSPVDLAPGATQSFVIAFTPTFAFDAHRVPMTFDCADSAAAIRTASNTLLLSTSVRANAMPWLLLLGN